MGMRGTHLWSTASLAIYLTVGASSLCQANEIGVQVLGGGSGSGTALATGDSAGVVSQTDWNVLPTSDAPGGGGPTTTTGIQLQDNTGASDVATLAVEAYNGTATGDTVQATGPNKGTSELFSGFNSETSTNGGYFEFTGIPYSSYNVYVYAMRSSSTVAETIGENSTGTGNAFAQSQGMTTETASTYAYTYDQASGTGNPIGNYVEFTNLSSSTLYIFSNSSAYVFSGVQIVQTPEPAAACTLGLAGIALGLKRRRQCRPA